MISYYLFPIFKMVTNILLISVKDFFNAPLIDSFSQSQPNLSDRHNRDKRSRSLATSDASNQSIQAELLRSYLEQVILINACLYLLVPSISVESYLGMVQVHVYYKGMIFIRVVCIPSLGMARE